MKLRRKAISLLLVLTMMLTFMPAMAFAADENGSADGAQLAAAQAAQEAQEAKARAAEAARAKAADEARGALQSEAKLELDPDEKNTKKALSLIYNGDKSYNKGIDGDEPDFYGFYTAGNEIVVKWEGGSESKFVCVEYKDKRYAQEDGTSVSYFPEGVTEPHYSTDPDDGDEYIDNDVYFDYSIDEEGNITVSHEYRYDYETEDGWDWDYETVYSEPFKGKCLESLKYEGPDVHYYEGDDPEDADFRQVGAKIIMQYSDGTTKTAECIQWGKEEWQKDYFFEGVTPQTKTETEAGETYTYTTNDVYFDVISATADKLVIEHDGAKGEIPISVKEYAKPESVKFKPVNGAAQISTIGNNYAYLEGEGNELEVTFDDGSVKKYVFKRAPGYDFWAFVNVSDEGDTTWTSFKSNTRFKKGTKEYAGKIMIEIYNGREYVDYWLPASVKVKATKYYAYVVEKSYTYTGKKVAPTVVVKYWTGSKMKTMPKSWYTCKPKKYSSHGWHSFKVTIKKAYRKKFGTSLWGSYSILPKKPTLKSATAGPGSIKVTWTKFTKAEQSRITKFYVEMSKSKDFTRNVTVWTVKKTAGTFTINSLTKDDKYYVRVVAVRTIKGESFWSKPSAAKLVTVK